MIVKSQERLQNIINDIERQRKEKPGWIQLDYDPPKGEEKPDYGSFNEILDDMAFLEWEAERVQDRESGYSLS